MSKSRDGQLPPAIAIRLKGKNSFNVAMTVIEELCAENAALRAEKEKLAAENKRLAGPACAA